MINGWYWPKTEKGDSTGKAFGGGHFVKHLLED